MSHEMAFKDGLLAAQAGKRVLARIQFEQADELSPNNPDYAIWLAWTADSPEEAAQILEQAATASPENEMLWAFKSIMEAMSQFQTGRDYSHFLLELIDASTHRAEHASFVEQDRPAFDDLEPPAQNQSNDPQSADEDVDLESDDDYRQIAETIIYQPHDLVGANPDDAKPIEELRPDPGHQKKGVTNASFPQPESDELQSSGEADPLEVTSQAQQDSLADLELNDVEIDTNEPEEYDAFADELEQTAAAVIQQVGEIQDEVDDALLEAQSGLEQENSASDEPSDTSENDEIEEADANLPSADAPLPADPLPRPKSNAILVVDDSPTVLKLVSMTLSGGGYEVKTANNGIEALKTLVNFTPALILLDVKMPQMDGYKLCKLIKRDEQMKQIPVVMLSDKDGMFDKLRGSFVGCNDYITKPFESADLLKQVRKYLGVSSD